MRPIVASLLVCIPLSAAPAEAAAPELDEALEALAAAVEQEENLSPRLRNAFSDVVEAMRREQAVETATPAVSASPASARFLEKLRPFADFRLRYEHNRNQPGRDDRNRARLRFRIGAEYDLHPELVAGFRVRTGDADDPNSPHQTFDGMFDSYEFELDRAYMRYRPAWLEGAWAVGGKFGHPFEANPIYGELVWDADVNPEGAALGYARDLGERHRLGFAVGEYVLEEQGNADEATLFAAQVSAGTRWSDAWSSRVAVGWYRYANLNPDGSVFSLRDNAGNAFVWNDDGDGVIERDEARYASDFEILNPHASVSWTGWRAPVTLAGELMLNTAALDGKDDDGFAVGLSVGKVSQARDWKLFYQFQRIEREAVFSPFAQDDFLLATNFSGHVAGLEYGLADGIALRAWGLISRVIDTPPGEFDDDQVRLRLDLNAKF